MKQPTTSEQTRLDEHYAGHRDWLHWGPYLAERQWGTVREDYSEDGDAWAYFTHDHSRSRTYRWGEDGIAGISDKLQRLCFAPTFWNGRDPILKERLFGLTNHEGNHGEDVKELYYYLDNTPTHSYMKHLYKYPQAAFPYDDLVQTNHQRTHTDSEYELLDTGIFDQNRYFDIVTEYAKADAHDLLIRITAYNRATPGRATAGQGPETAELYLLPTLWFRNGWSFGRMDQRSRIRRGEAGNGYDCLVTDNPPQESYTLYFQPTNQVLLTENETNTERIFGEPNRHPFVKDAFHTTLIDGNTALLADQTEGSKAAPVYYLTIAPGESATVQLRLTKTPITTPLGADFDQVFSQRITEANDFYAALHSHAIDSDAQLIQRQAFAGMLWSKQFYHIDIPQWLAGDPGSPPPPESRKHGRNRQWKTLNNNDIISMPDNWEYPWYAAWDLAFHCVPLATLDSSFAKSQLVLLLREWYMHPNGQLPAYEWSFSDVNPPVHAWACLQVYHMDAEKTGQGDLFFLKRVFQKLMLNFTWWVNRKDAQGNNVFEGGFLGLDNIGVFDRSSTIPGGGRLEQADGTSWMAMYCLNMLEMAVEIAQTDPAYEDVATKFFEHFVYIAESINRLGDNWAGAWDEHEGFFYDVLELPNGHYVPLKVRSLVGLTTLFAVMKIPKAIFNKLPHFTERMRWFQAYQKRSTMFDVVEDVAEDQDLLLSLIPPDRLARLLEALFDEHEFLAPGGIRSLSKRHQHGFHVQIEGMNFGLSYEPAESSSDLFGGNSNWRGPVWFPMNYLLIQALRIYHSYYGEQVTVEFPTGSGQKRTLGAAADQLTDRLINIFRPDDTGYRPVHGANKRYATDPHFKQLLLFYEYFCGDTARGVGASHQTGWTGIVAHLIASRLK